MTETPDYRGYRFPPDIIAHAVWLYHRFTLSFPDVEDLLAKRGIARSSILFDNGAKTSVPNTRGVSRNARGRATIGCSSTRCSSTSKANIDTCGAPSIRTMTSSRSSYTNARILKGLAASYPKLLRSQTEVSIEITTDKLRSYAAAKRDVMPSLAHCHDQYANNRAEVSHEPTREQEKQMHAKKSLRRPCAAIS
ncbi:MAG: putative transposase [Gammaproteobacteria bacterium]|jgi:putative transposase